MVVLTVLIRRAAALALLLGVAGCYDPVFPDEIPCSPAGTCPPGEHCGADGICRVQPLPGDASAAMDVAVEAGATPDAATPDAASPADLAGCGGPCCQTSNQCLPGYACIGGQCSQSCGTRLAPCCNVTGCRLGYVCDGSKCVDCGAVGEPCCDTDTCVGGCCSGGTCIAGNIPTSCGTSGACIDCTRFGTGHACLSGICGCKDNTDCSAGQTCTVNAATCTCLGDGASCVNDPGACCNGNCTAFPLAVQTCGCIPDGTECAQDPDCCTGRCVKGICGRKPQCAADGGPCQTAVDCCAGICASGTHCQCQSNGSGCNTDAQCCSGNCTGLACQ
jgi:hypothetical protein